MRLNRTKLYYISLCLFFLIGGAIQAYSQGSTVDDLPDMSWYTPENFSSYINQYLSDKVNPSTMADVLVTEYIHQPQEATGALVLFPSQSVVHEQRMDEGTISNIKTHIVSGNNYNGTIVGVTVFVQKGNSTKWVIESHDTVTTQGLYEKQTIEVNIELKPIIFHSEGGSIKVIITNYGNEFADEIYVLTSLNDDEMIQFSGINTIVNAENSLYLTITNQNRELNGYRYLVDYKKHAGIQLHKISYRSRSDGKIEPISDEIIGLYEYPSLKRLDSDLYRYNNHKTFIDNYFGSILDDKLRTYLNDVMAGLPIIGGFFRYSRPQKEIAYSTSPMEVEHTLFEVVDGFTKSSQTNLQQAVNPAIQTLLITEEANTQDTSIAIEEHRTQIELFQSIFINDYNELETKSKYSLNQISYTKYELLLEGQQKGKWIFDISKSVDSMITEINLVNDQLSNSGLSFRQLLNDLNKKYYSAAKSGTQGITELFNRGWSQAKVEESSISFEHLIRVIRDVLRPDFSQITIETDPGRGKITIKNNDGVILSKYGMLNPSEFSGISSSLLSSQAEKISTWITKSFGPWATLQTPDERPVYEWNDLIYSMAVDRGSFDYFDPVINTSRPDALSMEGAGDTPAGWYMGNGVYDYGPTDWEPFDHDWHTGGVDVYTGAELSSSTDDIKIIGGNLGYWTPDYRGFSSMDNPLDNNGWIMYDLGSNTPTTGQWRVSFDFKKNKTSKERIGNTFPLGTWYEGGLGVMLTNDIGVRELIEREGEYSDELDFYMHLSLDEINSYATDYIGMAVYDPVLIKKFENYVSFYPDSPYQYGDSLRGARWPNGQLSDAVIHRYFHEMTYTHNPIDFAGVSRATIQMLPNTWHHLDLVYDEWTNHLNVFLDGELVGSNIFMPELNNVEGEPTLENIWFYNYGHQYTTISNLEISEQVAPIPIPLKTSVVNIEDMTSQERSITGAQIPYWDTTNNIPLWSAQSWLDSSTNSIIQIGDDFNIGLGDKDAIYWLDMNKNGEQDPAEYIKREDALLGKFTMISSQYDESESTNYLGLKPLQGNDVSNFLNQFEYNMGYSVPGASIEGLREPYPDAQRDYSQIVLWDDFENLVMSLLMTDYDYSTTDFSYHPNATTPWTGSEYHEILWGKAVDDILSTASGNEIDVQDIDGWGQVLLSLIQLTDATSSYKISPLWLEHDGISTPGMYRDETAQAYVSDSNWPGTILRGYSHNDYDKYATAGYAGVVSYVSQGSLAVSSFYAGESQENVTTGGSKWYTFGLPATNVDDFYLTTAMLQNGNLNNQTPFSGITQISGERLIIEGAREFVSLSTDPVFNSYSLHLVTGDSTMGPLNGQTIVVAVHWLDENTPDKIYTDPTELFVVLRDNDDSGTFESYYNGPLGQHLACQYITGNAYEFITMDPADRPGFSLDWLMETLSGLIFGFIESMPILSDIWDMLINLFSEGMTALVGVLAEFLLAMMDEIIAILFTPSEANIEHQVNYNDIDPTDGTFLDDGRVLIDSTTGLPALDGDQYRPYGIANNGIDDEFDQKGTFWLSSLTKFLNAFSEISTTNARGKEVSGMDALSQAMFSVYNDMPVNLWNDIPAQSIYENGLTIKPGTVVNTGNPEIDKIIKLLQQYEAEAIKSKDSRLPLVPSTDRKAGAQSTTDFNFNSIYYLFVIMFLPTLMAQLESEQITPSDFGLNMESADAISMVKYLISNIGRMGVTGSFNFDKFKGLYSLMNNFFKTSITEGTLNFDEIFKNSAGALIDYAKTDLVKNDGPEYIGTTENFLFWDMVIPPSAIGIQRDVVFGDDYINDEGNYANGDQTGVITGLDSQMSLMDTTRFDRTKTFLELIYAAALDKTRGLTTGETGPTGSQLPEAVVGARTRDTYSYNELRINLGGVEVPILDIWLQDQLYQSYLSNSRLNPQGNTYATTGPSQPSGREAESFAYESSKSDVLGAMDDVVVYFIHPNMISSGRTLTSSNIVKTFHSSLGIRWAFKDQQDFNSYFGYNSITGEYNEKLPIITVYEETRWAPGNRRYPKNHQYWNHPDRDWETAPDPIFQKKTRPLIWADIENNKMVLRNSHQTEIQGFMAFLQSEELKTAWGGLDQVRMVDDTTTGFETPLDGEIILEYQDGYSGAPTLGGNIKPGQRVFRSTIIRPVNVFRFDSNGDQMTKTLYMTEEQYFQYQKDNDQKTWQIMKENRNVDGVEKSVFPLFESFPLESWVSFNLFAELEYKLQIESMFIEKTLTDPKTGLKTLTGTSTQRRYDKNKDIWVDSPEKLAIAYAENLPLDKYGTIAPGVTMTWVLPIDSPVAPGKTIQQYFDSLDMVDLEGRMYSEVLGRPITLSDYEKMTQKWTVYRYIDGKFKDQRELSIGDLAANPPRTDPEGNYKIEYYATTPLEIKAAVSRLSNTDPNQRVTSLNDVTNIYRWSPDLNMFINAEVAVRLGIVEDGSPEEQVQNFLTTGYLTSSMPISNCVEISETMRKLPTDLDLDAWRSILPAYEALLSNDPTVKDLTLTEKLVLVRERYLQDQTFLKIKNKIHSETAMSSQKGMSGAQQMTAGAMNYLKGGLGTSQATDEEDMSEADRAEIMANFDRLLPRIELPHDMVLLDKDGNSHVVPKETNIQRLIVIWNEMYFGTDLTIPVYNSNSGNIETKWTAFASLITVMLGFEDQTIYWGYEDAEGVTQTYDRGLTDGLRNSLLTRTRIELRDVGDRGYISYNECGDDIERKLWKQSQKTLIYLTDAGLEAASLKEGNEDVGKAVLTNPDGELLDAPRFTPEMSEWRQTTVCMENSLALVRVPVITPPPGGVYIFDTDGDFKYELIFTGLNEYFKSTEVNTKRFFSGGADKKRLFAVDEGTKKTYRWLSEAELTSPTTKIGHDGRPLVWDNGIKEAWLTPKQAITTGAADKDTISSQWYDANEFKTTNADGKKITEDTNIGLKITTDDKIDLSDPDQVITVEIQTDDEKKGDDKKITWTEQIEGYTIVTKVGRKTIESLKSSLKDAVQAEYIEFLDNAPFIYGNAEKGFATEVVLDENGIPVSITPVEVKEVDGKLVPVMKTDNPSWDTHRSFVTRPADDRKEEYWLNIKTGKFYKKEDLPSPNPQEEYITSFKIKQATTKHYQKDGDTWKIVNAENSNTISFTGVEWRKGYAKSITTWENGVSIKKSIPMRFNPQT